MGRKGKTAQLKGDHGGGRHIAPPPYSEDRLENHFAEVRELAFGKEERRQCAETRQCRSPRRRCPPAAPSQINRTRL